MKVVLSVDAVRFPLTGIGRYTYELARHLERSPDITELHYMAGRRFLPGLPSASDTSDGQHGLKRLVQTMPVAIEAYRLLMPWLKGQTLKGHEHFLYHSTNYYLPPFKGLRVATFHDLSPFVWPQCHSPHMARFLRKELTQTVRRADRLITVSEFTRQELANYFDWPLDRIDTVPLASAAVFHPREEAELRPVLERHGLKVGGYTLFVGTIEPRKNIQTLLDAYQRLPLATRTRWPLVLTGYHGWCSEAIHERLESARREGWAYYLGFVPGQDLPPLLAGARLFTFPSLYEGFGLPVLEAMASGVPVVCSTTSSLPEVAGDAALMCEAMDVEALTALLARGLEDDAWRAHAVPAGLAHAARFSWERCALETLNVYRRTVASR
ncbi:glycosyltransferase family 1 protein [Pseudomonas sp. 22-AL-CL-001]|uniref:glycosyltransferase family 4 protein n=1 Tax=Pseudomonas alabamensis TaxID=3064349 RepID=UPI00271363AB|nr:glycosyltransferase family 1 protein [Pseudomonas sp. 22-AL-CL-001]MDO7910185.1 glycosyltransferase family 1 protein [Pseudomonas sp. 22-AL-CL-001]